MDQSFQLPFLVGRQLIPGSVLHLMGPVYVTNHLLPYLPISLLRIIPHSGLKRPLRRLLLLLSIDFDPRKKPTSLAEYQLLGHIDRPAKTVTYPLQRNLIVSG